MQQKDSAMVANGRTSASRLTFEVSTYDGEEFEAFFVDREQLKEFDFKRFDCLIADCLGVLGFRTPAGKWIQYDGRWPRIGSVALSIIGTVMDNPGVYLTPSDVVRFTGNEDLFSASALASRVCAIRKTFHESKEKQYFFLTRDRGRMALAWPKDKTWAQVRISTTQNGDQS